MLVTLFCFDAVTILEGIDSQMAYQQKQTWPYFDAVAIRKRKKTKGVKVHGKDGATGSEGSGGLVHETLILLSSPKRLLVEGGSVAEETPEGIPIPDSPGIPKVALPLTGSSARSPPPPGLVSFGDPDPLMKDASHFIIEFDGYAGTPITSIYDLHFLNEVL